MDGGWRRWRMEGWRLEGCCWGVRELGNGQTKVEQAGRAEVNTIERGQAWAGMGRHGLTDPN